MPEIILINTAAYAGAVGNKILVQAHDDCRGAKLHVVIKTSAGVLIEECDAVETQDGLTWEYVATKANVAVAGCVVTDIAYDLPGKA